MKDLIKRILYPLFGLSVPDKKINIYKTIIFNIIAFGVKGLRLPVYIYNNTNIYKVGKIILHCPIKHGLIRIGQLDLKSQGKTKFKNAGTIEVWGPVKIEGCTILENDGIIEFHGFNRIADGSLVVIRKKLVIGEQSRIGFQSFVMDSDDHFLVDVTTKEVIDNKKEIFIGKYNWIASRTVIKKGVKTPDYLIVASANALLTKDYTDLPPYSVVGGMPVKLLKTGVRRIYNIENERNLNEYFKKKNENSFLLDDSIEMEKYCLQQ
ncbi:MAG: hypothetical protein IKQ46_14235 [Bacteroidales bacterium]|nr:hypothetical protein [Bacteroidales bacterium]MBR4497551.1 hypothetical protein [Bacteroidales bacterium]